MEEHYSAYLSVLDALAAELENLACLAQEQCAAVRRDDLLALDDVMKREQVASLSLRGKEQKRQKLAMQLGLDGTRLSALPRNVPAALVSRAQETAQSLQRGYSLYQEAAQVARTTLELNLHEIEKILAAHGAAPAGGPAAAGSIRPPENMKTDFRA